MQGHPLSLFPVLTASSRPDRKRRIHWSGPARACSHGHVGAWAVTLAGPAVSVAAALAVGLGALKRVAAPDKSVAARNAGAIAGGSQHGSRWSDGTALGLECRGEMLIDERLVLSVVPIGAEICESGRRVNGRRSRSRAARAALTGPAAQTPSLPLTQAT